ncbi:hypothetical protein [Erythrobacter colymbi]|uniref:hypothetical protein n=1 Tax=Erythrobacter colymbi TaxID=1161202 RepID=UPI00117CCF6E|nr:hypothetical protein [Erythrobacter colymbi]
MENFLGIFILGLTSLIPGTGSSDLHPRAINYMEFLSPVIKVPGSVLVTESYSQPPVHRNNSLVGYAKFFASLKNTPTQGQGDTANHDFDIRRNSGAGIDQFQLAIASPLREADAEKGQHALFHQSNGLAGVASSYGGHGNGENGSHGRKGANQGSERRYAVVFRTDPVRVASDSDAGPLSAQVRIPSVNRLALASWAMVVGLMFGPFLVGWAIVSGKPLLTRNRENDAILGGVITNIGFAAFIYLAFAPIGTNGL